MKKSLRCSLFVRLLSDYVLLFPIVLNEGDILNDYIEARDTGHHVFATRGYIGLEDVPALLIYRIDKDAEKTGQGRESIKSIEDIIGYAIIISGDGQAHTGPTYLSVKG